MLTYKKIYLVGFMGSGKSTMGRKLAASLGWSFIDLDKRIEEETGMNIPDIFLYKGEDYFRATETRLLRSLENFEETIISTGGGTPCYHDNMDFMLRTGLTIYLKLTPAQLKSRLKRSADKRPLLRNVTEENLESYIQLKLAEREVWYNKAKIIVDGLVTDTRFLKTLIENSVNG
ncbi:MAG: shikimate kinase [Bacteroidales bacterium]|nr:shikimate kinase [Bacteroidales bacterium]